MHLFGCGKPQSPRSAQPTIPLILRGKKKQFKQRKQQLPPPQFLKIQKPKPIEILSVSSPKRLVSKVIRPITHQRSLSVPRTITIYRPMQKIPVQIQSHAPQNIHKTNSINRSISSSKGDYIRRNLDQNLHRIYRELNERRLNFNIQNNKIYQSSQLSGPKLQQNLVHQYIKLIYQEYKIPDPLKRQKQDYRHVSNSINESISTQPNRRTDSRRRVDNIIYGSTNRKAVQLKQSFLVQMFSPAEKLQLNQQQNHVHQHQQFNSRKQSHKNRLTAVNTFRHSGNLAQITQMAERQIQQTYRYCFVCQQPILQANISIHQKEKCPQFCNLYDMSLSQIKTALMRKITRLKQQSQYNYQIVFGDQHQKRIRYKLQNLKRQTKKYLSSVDSNIKKAQNIKPTDRLKTGEPIVSKNQLKNQFSSVMECYEQNYFKLYENLRKLQWFSVMLKNLEQKYYFQSNKNRQKSQQLNGRAKLTNNENLDFEGRRYSLAH